MTHPIIPTKSNELISIDYYGPLPTSKGRVKYIISVIDVFTKYVVIYPIKKATKQISLNKIIKHYIPTYRKLDNIQSDWGTQFTSRKWVNTLKEHDKNQFFLLLDTLKVTQSRELIR